MKYTWIFYSISSRQVYRYQHFIVNKLFKNSEAGGACVIYCDPMDANDADARHTEEYEILLSAQCKCLTIILSYVTRRSKRYLMSPGLILRYWNNIRL